MVKNKKGNKTMKEITIKMTLKTENKNETHIISHREYDETKWNKIQKICDYQKANILDLIEEFLEKLTPEEAEKIVVSWDMPKDNRLE